MGRVRTCFQEVDEAMPSRSHPRALMLSLSLFGLVGCGGCGSQADVDERHALEIAQQAMSDQRRQNEQMAEQSKAVVEESQRLAEAAREFVIRDAEARKELLESHRTLQSELNGQQSRLDMSRSRLEEERRDIAATRVRDPVIATSIQQAGLLLACLSPLAVCIVLLRSIDGDHSQDAVLTEMLTHELISDSPTLLGGPEPSDRDDRSMAFLADAEADVSDRGVTDHQWPDDFPDHRSEEPPPF